MKKKIKKILIIIFLLFVGVTLSFAKYIYNESLNYYLESKELYFESDELTLNTKKHNLLTWNGDDISFVVKNYVDASKVTEYDISYKASCKVLGAEANYIECNFIDTNTSTYEGVLSSQSYCDNIKDDIDVSKYNKTDCELNGYVWKIEQMEKQLNFNLNSTDNNKEIDEVTVEVVLESTKPYKKVLKGIFNINKKNIEIVPVIVDLKNYTDFDELNIINNSSEKRCLSVTLQTDNYIIEKEKVFDYEETNKTITFEIEVNSNNDFSLELYKKDITKQYFKENINIVEKEC